MRREVDTDADGGFDTVSTFENDIERHQVRDLNDDGKPEFEARYDTEGRTLREDHDTSEDGSVDLTRHFEAGELARETRDTNADGRHDLHTWFEADVRVRSEADTRGDGKPDTFIEYVSEQKTAQTEDRNGDGEIDARYRFDAFEKLLSEELDEDYDGYFEVASEFDAGELRRRSYDAERRGSAGRVEFHGEGRLFRVELDQDGDGKVELWNFYDPEERLEKQEQDRAADGKVDTYVTLDPATGKELRVLRDTDADGEIDSWRINHPDGSTERLEEDRNRDGKADRFVTFAEGKPSRFEEDSDYDGRLDTQGDLGPEGDVLADERDTDGDGAFRPARRVPRWPQDPRGTRHQRRRQLRRGE